MICWLEGIVTIIRLKDLSGFQSASTKPFCASNSSMIDPEQFKEVLTPVLKVARILHGEDYLTRGDVELVRTELTKALAKVNAIERAVVGVPPPQTGE